MHMPTVYKAIVTYIQYMYYFDMCEGKERTCTMVAHMSGRGRVCGVGTVGEVYCPEKKAT